MTKMHTDPFCVNSSIIRSIKHEKLAVIFNTEQIIKASYSYLMSAS